MVVFTRGATGALVETSRTSTGGNGRTNNAPFSTSNLDSQGGVDLSDDQHLVFAVNAGSDTLSSFRVKPGGGLELVGSVPTGDAPFSVDSHGDLVYVLNEDDGTIQGYRASDTGQLTPIPGSVEPLSVTGSGAAAAQIGFDPSGNVLTVPHRLTAPAAPADRIDTFVLGSDGTPSAAVVNDADGASPSNFIPFGFAYDGNGHLLVTNAGDASISSYELNTTTGALTFIDNQGTGGSNPCWLAITPDSKFAFAGDSGADVVSRLEIAANGTLTALAPAASVPGSGVAADVALSPDGEFLTALVPTENNTATSQTDTYSVGANGSLTLVNPGGQTTADLPGGVTGLAVSDADASAPDTAITAGPEGGSTTNDNTPTLDFGTVPAGEPNPSFSCSIDGGTATPCVPPFTTPALGEGEHAISVAASDFGGNADATPATRSFSVDSTPPDTTIVAGPENRSLTSDRTPTFEFSSSADGSTFSCTVDVGTAVPCTSPFTTEALSDGAHVFTVEATDAAGNTDPAPAVRSFDVQRLLGCRVTGTQIVGTSRSNSLTGTSGIDLMFGLGGRDFMRGRANRDCLYGGLSNDRLNGGTGGDLLFGGSGADKLTDSSGRDSFSGGSGTDRINSRDTRRAGRRARDRVRCGPGRRDVALVDRRDIVAPDCERIRRR
jgi:6-phosphogluconolactonase (cycloisomerase 2 family)